MSGGHAAAAFSAAAAGVHTVLHVAYSLAIICAFFANLCTLAASVLMVRRIDQHEIGARTANLSARREQAKVLRLDMLTAQLETMIHCRAEANLVAAQAFIDTRLHFS